MKILFICTHNRCRSILAEAICNHYSDDLLQAVSAGSNPAERIHPLTLRALRTLDIATDKLRSQSWDDFEDSEIDYVITVCDRAAREPCPVWFGNARQVHWGLPDPSAVEGDPETISAAFTHTINILKSRMKQVKSWLQQGLDGDELYRHIKSLAD